MYRVRFHQDCAGPVVGGYEMLQSSINLRPLPASSREDGVMPQELASIIILAEYMLC